MVVGQESKFSSLFEQSFLLLQGVRQYKNDGGSMTRYLLGIERVGWYRLQCMRKRKMTAALKAVCGTPFGGLFAFTGIQGGKSFVTHLIQDTSRG